MVVDGSLLPRSIRWRIQLGLLQVPEDLDGADPALLNSLTELNRTRVEEQRAHYDALLEKHFASIRPIEEEEEESLPEAQEEPTVEEEDLLDPLTAMVMEQEAREKRRKELDLKYRKERARRNRGMSVEAEDDDKWKDESFSVNEFFDNFRLFAPLRDFKTLTILVISVVRFHFCDLFSSRHKRLV